MNRDYQRIEKAIHYLCEHKQHQPGLDELAAQVHLSPAHFQRLFQRWAGVSPKQFLQFLTVEHAKLLLAGSDSVMAAAQTVGLSGSGRLHDHFLVLEGLSPGQYRSGGEGMTLSYGVGDSPFGEFLLVNVASGAICHLVFLPDDGLAAALMHLQAQWPRANWRRDDTVTLALGDLLAGTASGRTLRLQPLTTNFKLKVWQALLQVPSGRLVSYQQLAQMAGQPAATRAVASAVAANPIAGLIPCHRVIRASGVIGQYRWGRDRKQAMIAWEQAKAQT